MLRKSIAVVLIVLFSLGLPQRAGAYAIGTHEFLLDLVWESSIVPLLLAYYPKTKPQELIDARGYAYGGALIQDGGYYAFEKPFLSDVTHYVRSGDFVVNLFRNQRDVYELAFAIGALAHYVGDTYGHREATNPAVYLSLGGHERGHHVKRVPDKSVTYEQDETQHTRVEFGFDVNAAAHHRFLPDNFHQAVGVQVALQQYALAYYQTYGIAEDFVSSRREFKLYPYHATAFHILPYVANSLTTQPRWSASDEGSSDAQKTLVAIAACINEREFRPELNPPAAGNSLVAHAAERIHKLDLVPVNRTTEELYARSVLLAASALSRMLTAGFMRSASGIPQPTAALYLPYYSGDAPADPEHPLINLNLDTGYAQPPATYDLTDNAYLSLLHRIARNPNVPVPAATQQDIQAYFQDRAANFAFAGDRSKLQKMNHDLDKLAVRAPSTSPLPRQGFDQTKPKENELLLLVEPIPDDHAGCKPTTYAPLQAVLSGKSIP